jgi:hypothetical protein
MASSHANLPTMPARCDTFSAAKAEQIADERAIDRAKLLMPGLEVAIRVAV